MRRVALAAVAIAVCFTLAFCGGGGGGSSSFTNPSTPGNSTPPPALSITTTRLPDGVTGKAYSAQLQATGGKAPYTWSTTTALPSWMSLDATSGTVSGTPSAYTSIYITFVVTDSSSPAATVQKQVYVAAYAPLSFSGTAPSAVLNLPYSWQTSISGGSYPFTATVDSGLPSGINFSVQNGSTLVFSGTPTAAGDFTVNVHLKDSANPPQDVIVPAKISVANTVAISTTKLRSGVIGRPYSDTVTTVNGTPPFRWTATNLPAGLSIDSASGVVSGTPTAGVNFGSTQVTVTDSSTPSQSDSRNLQISVYQALTWTASTSLSFHINEYTITNLYSYGSGIPPVTATVVSGTLPPGMQISGVSLQGSPTQVGVYTPTIHVQDSDSPPGFIEQTFTMNVLPPLPVLSDLPLPMAAIGKPYSAKLWARDGTLPYAWSVVGGQLPPGLSLNTDGSISGTPTTLPPYSENGFTFTAAVTDSASPPQTAKRDYHVVVSNSAQGRNDSIANATPASYPGLNASLSPFADPPGSTTSAPDTDYYRLSGKAGTVIEVYVGGGDFFDPALEIVDANGQRYKTCQDPGDDNPTLTFIVKDTTPTAYDDECLNDDVDPTVNRSADLKFQVPGAAGTQITFYVHVFESGGNARPDLNYNLSLSSEALPPLTIATKTLPGASLGVAYSTNLSGGGGMMPWSWQVASGSLPPGLSVSNDASKGWVITGTPTAKGSFDFTLSITDAETPPQTLSRQFNITVYDPLVIATDKFPDLKAGAPYSYVIPVTGGIPPYQWGSFSASWCCLTLNQTTGEWTDYFPFPGTTTQTYSINVNVTDATGRYTSKTLTLTVSP